MTPLRQRMLEDMGIRNLAENTQLSYLQQVSSYARFFGRSPEQLGPEQVRTYQLHLRETRKLAPSSIAIAVSALRFLYKVTLKRNWAPDDIPMPKLPFKLPVILSPEEVMHFLNSIANLKHRTILTAAYAAGLRVSEATMLKVTNIDSKRMVLRADDGKGAKDRDVMLSPRLLEELRSYWRSPSLPTCSSPAPTCAGSNCCSAIAAWPRPLAISRSPPALCARRPVPTTCCPRSRHPRPNRARQPSSER